jgi:hypothetical protein
MERTDPTTVEAAAVIEGSLWSNELFACDNEEDKAAAGRGGNMCHYLKRLNDLRSTHLHGDNVQKWLLGWVTESYRF